MKHKLCLLVFLLSIISCKQSDSSSDLSSGEIHKTDLELEKLSIEKVLSDQQDAWNAGNIDAFMKGYWNSPELTFIGSRGLTKGWQQTLENYKKSYPDKKTMGRLHFDVLKTDIIDANNAIIIGRYTLYREKDEPTGLFTLRWKKISGEWKIISDQTCG